MRRRVMMVLLVSLVGLVAGGLWAPAETQAGTLQRLKADYVYFNGSEAATTAWALDLGGGKQIYVGGFLLPDSVNVLYITVVATGNEKDNPNITPTDTNNEALAALWVSCFVDGVACNAGAPIGTSTMGWVNLQKRGPGLRDNNLAYTWCTPAPMPGLHSVSLNMASSNRGRVALSAAHVYIDGAFFTSQTDGCNSLD